MYKNMGVCRFHTSPAFDCFVSQLRMSPTRQAVTRLDNFTGFGNSPVLHLRQRVDELIGTTSGISWACLRYPVSGNVSKDVGVGADIKCTFLSYGESSVFVKPSSPATVLPTPIWGTPSVQSYFFSSN